jgi:hypothetical protein
MATPRRISSCRPAALTLALAVAACAPVASTALPATAAGQTAPPGPISSPAGARTVPPSTVAPSPTPLAPLPSGVLRLPSDFAIELEPGRYSSSPPFERFFTFEVDDPGWRAGHLNAEFFDIQRFDGVPTTGLPSRILAFAHPDTIHGPTSVPATELTPEAAVAALTARDDLVTKNVAELELFGRPSVRVDVHAPVDNTPVFGGADGTFRQSADLDARLVAVPIDGGLLLVLVQATPQDLEPAWDQALSILETVQL